MQILKNMIITYLWDKSVHHRRLNTTLLLKVIISWYLWDNVDAFLLLLAVDGHFEKSKSRY